MSVVVRYDPDTNEVLEIIPFAHTPAYIGRPDCIVFARGGGPAEEPGRPRRTKRHPELGDCEDIADFDKRHHAVERWRLVVVTTVNGRRRMTVDPDAIRPLE